MATCPGCLSDVEGKEGQSLLKCERCGHSFSAGAEEDLPPLEMVMENQSLMANKVKADEAPRSEVAEDPDEFTESNATFDEIRQFGEELIEKPLPEVVSTPKESSLKGANPAEVPAPLGEPFQPSMKSSPSSRKSSGVGPMVAGDLTGKRITDYLMPISVSVAFDHASSNPIGPGFATLWESASNQGANAVVGIQWQITPGSTHVIVSGTPVKTTPEN